MSELEKRLKAIRDKIVALSKECEAFIVRENAGETLTPEEREKITENTKTYDDLKKQERETEKLIEIDAHLRSSVKPPIKLDPAEPSDIHVGEPKERKAPFKQGIGELMHCIARAARGQRLDPRLEQIQLEAAERNSDNPELQVRAATGGNTIFPSEGGWAVGLDFSEQLMQSTYDENQLVGLCAKDTVGPNKDSVSWWDIEETARAAGSRHGGIRGYWTSQAADYTASKPKLIKRKLDLEKITALIYATDEQLDDAAALGSRTMRLVPKEFSFNINDGIINGSGSGQPMGILTGPALISQAKETGQDAATIVAENIINAYSRVVESSLPSSSLRVIYNHECFPQLMQMHIKVGTGGQLVYMPPSGLAGAPFGTLMGVPIVPVEQCAALGTAGDIIIADFDEYLWIDKGGMKSDVSIHVEFVSGQVVFRFSYRCNGMPVWSSAVTPYKATPTVGPYVAIAARA